MISRFKIFLFWRRIFILSGLIPLVFTPLYLSAQTNQQVNLEITVILAQCADGADNDSDGKIDYPDDPGCSSSTDNDETDILFCGDNICSSFEACSSCPADCGSCPGGGGGGGGGSYIPPPPIFTQVIFKGLAYPQSNVTLLKDAQVAATTKAGSDAKFEISLSGLSGGTYTFGVWAEDTKGNRSITYTFTISITAGAITTVSGIFLPPTINTDKSEVRRGDTIAIFGQSVPKSEIDIVVDSKKELFLKTQSDEQGIYSYILGTNLLEFGEYFAKSKAVTESEVSGFSRAISFLIGTNNVIKTAEKPVYGKADFNYDGRVNLIDFSILIYWFDKMNPPAKFDLNNDKNINVYDFSIMAYYWTG